LPDDTADWIEQPVPTAPQRTFVDVSDGRIGLLVANRGLPEYEAIPTAEGTTIAVTLLRCVGWLSRDDFPARRGHAGPAAMAVPDAQCLGRWTFEYALVPHAGDWASSLAFQQAHFFNSPLRAMTVSVQRGDLPPEAGFIEVEPAVLVVSAVKLAEDDDGLIVRVYNATDAPVEGRVRLLRPFRRAVRTNLNERELTEIAHDDRQVTLAVRGKEVVTLKIEF
jgi:alpha-mannosidase